jgi:alkyl sulfatase BDS1-like metallo-beta-lactamase superfamily hydrolase
VLDEINLCVTSLDQAVADGAVTVEGAPEKLAEFVGLLGGFELWLPIVTP